MVDNKEVDTTNLVQNLVQLSQCYLCGSLNLYGCCSKNQWTFIDHREVDRLLLFPRRQFLERKDARDTPDVIQVKPLLP